MFIKPLEYEHHQFDVFLGYGWESWVRVRFDKNKVQVVKTNVEDLEPQTLRLIYFKIKKMLSKRDDIPIGRNGYAETMHQL